MKVSPGEDTAITERLASEEGLKFGRNPDSKSRINALKVMLRFLELLIWIHFSFLKSFDIQHQFQYSTACPNDMAHAKDKKIQF